MKLFYFSLCCLATFYASGQKPQVIGNTEVIVDTLNAQLTSPWEIQLENNNALWVTERTGIVSRINLETGAKDTMLNLSGSIITTGEGGLLGMVLFPSFPAVAEVLLVYTYGPVDADGNFYERLVRYSYDGESLVNPVTLLEGIPAHSSHDGSRLFFLPDRTLLMSTGDHNQPELAQNPASLSGKYLRINTDGSIPSNNPDPTSMIYTSGNRNSQGIAVLPGNKWIISETGADSDDELQILEPGKNYGWPLIRGFCDDPSEDSACASGLYQEPIYNWTPTIGPADMVYYENSDFPEWDGHVLMTTLAGEKLVALTLNEQENQVVDEDVYFEHQFGRLRDIAVGEDKTIYLATNSGDAGHQAIIRIIPPYFPLSGDDDLSAAHPIKLVPAPVNEQLIIYLAFPRADIAIVNSNGQVMINLPQLESGTKVPIIKLEPGTYYVEMAVKGELLARERIIKYR